VVSEIKIKSFLIIFHESLINMSDTNIWIIRIISLRSEKTSWSRKIDGLDIVLVKDHECQTKASELYLTGCYGLNRKCTPQKAHALKAWSPVGEVISS
jgi:hypothetical protein